MIQEKSILKRIQKNLSESMNERELISLKKRMKNLKRKREEIRKRIERELNSLSENLLKRKENEFLISLFNSNQS